MSVLLPTRQVMISKNTWDRLSQSFLIFAYNTSVANSSGLKQRCEGGKE